MRSQSEALAAYEARMTGNPKGRLSSGLGMTGTPKSGTSAPMRDMHETKEFMPLVVELAERCGWRVYHTHDSRKSAKGFGDLVMVRAPAGYLPRCIYAELKTEKGVMTEDQQAWMADMCAVAMVNHTMEAHLWRPEHWWNGEIERVLR